MSTPRRVMSTSLTKSLTAVTSCFSPSSKTTRSSEPSLRWALAQNQPTYPRTTPSAACSTSRKTTSSTPLGPTRPTPATKATFCLGTGRSRSKWVRICCTLIWAQGGTALRKKLMDPISQKWPIPETGSSELKTNLKTMN